MRLLKMFLKGLLGLLLLAVVALYVTGNGHVLRGVRCTYLVGKSKPDIDDLPYFDVSKMAATQPVSWPVHAKYNLGRIPQEFDQQLDSLSTTAFLVFRNDSLLFEQYWKKFDENTVGNSFSMAKSFTAMLVGRAIDDGFLKSLDEPVGHYLPEFNEGKNAGLTIRHLLQMSSGIPFGESYSSPFGFMARAYYGDELEEETMKFRVEKDPGTFWTYEGGNTILLGLILKKATGKTPSDYFMESFWGPMNAEHEAYWNLDHEGGLEKTFTGFYATARDFGRIGKLFMHDGVWEGDTLLSPEFVKNSLQPNMIPDETGEACSWYGLHWWLGEQHGQKFFSCRGLRGQYIIGIPEANLVIVRLGHLQRKDRTAHMPPDLFMYMDIARSIAAQTN
ncbi:MAG: beta-lactamase family protein [Flavobacteriales bacterium]|nr:beta-lactamase family protein [Flavobacteriales bacterium]